MFYSKKLYWHLFVGLVFLLLVIFPSLVTLQSVQAQAALAPALPQANWIDNKTIKFDNQDYLETTLNGDTSYIRKDAVRDLCTRSAGAGIGTVISDDINKYSSKVGQEIPLIRDFNDARDRANHIRYKIIIVSNRDPNAGQEINSTDTRSSNGKLIGSTYACKEIQKFPIALTQAYIANTVYRWENSTVIQHANEGKDYVFEPGINDIGHYVWQKDPKNDCKEHIDSNPNTNAGGNPSIGTLYHNGNLNGAGSCNYDVRPITISRIESSTAPAGTDPGGIAGAGDSTTGQNPGEKPSCESGGGEMSWILCPTLRLASSFVTQVDKKLNELLTLPSSYYDDPQVEATWGRMRNIAYIILIPVMLVMILSTALGFEFISAYAFKKALPRFVIAVLFISLSFEITKFLIVLTNDVGRGILGLITSSFNGQGDLTLASLFDPGGVTGGFFTGVVVGGSILALGLIPVILSYLFVAGAVLLIALLALAFRQMLLITFMVLSPLAILAWIFPGNDKVWKLWWGAFSKLLILFPLIMVLIAGGRAFAALVQDAGGNDFLATILKLTAYIAPYFFIPAMFKFAGGIFGTVTGMVNDRSKGLFDRQKQYRSRKYKEKGEAAKDGNYFRGSNRLSRGLSRGIQSAALAPEAGLNPRYMRRQLAAARGRHAFDDSTKGIQENANVKSLWGDDDLAHAILEGDGDETKIRAALKTYGGERFFHKNADGTLGAVKDKKMLDDAVARVKLVNKEFGGSTAKVIAGRSLSTSSTAWKNTKVRNADGTETTTYDASGKMLRDFNRIAGNDRVMFNRLVGEGREAQVRAGRNDTGAGGFADTQLAGQQMWLESGGGEPSSEAMQGATKKVSRSVLKGKSAAAALGEKAYNPEALAPLMLEDTEAAFASGNEEEAIRAIATLAGTQDALNSTSPQNARILSEQVFGQKVDLNTLPSNLRQQLVVASGDPTTTHLTHGQIINELRNNETFNTMRREYTAQGIGAINAQTAALAAANAQIQGQGQLPFPPPNLSGKPPL